MRLAWRICVRQSYYGLYAELCRTYSIPFPFMVRRGQGVKTHSLLLRQARITGLFVVDAFTNDEKKALCAGYEGKCARVFFSRGRRSSLRG